MDNLDIKRLRAAVADYTKRSAAKALLCFFVDFGIYAAAIAGVLLLENTYARVACAVLAGFKISTLFVIAHDAAHDSLTNSRKLNRLLGRITFLPSLHSFSLWVIAHNRNHHQLANLKGANSWAPISKQDYDALPAWKRVLMRLYRSPFGLGIYYVIERWWKDKYFPFKRTVGCYNKIYWLDFALVTTYLMLFVGALVMAGMISAHTTPAQNVVLGFLVPFIVFNYMMGFTIYQHHTHETIPWFDNTEELLEKGPAEEVTMHVKFPHWYNLLSHNIMEHTAHHVDPRIPMYNLDKAQKRLSEILGSEMHCKKFSLVDFLFTMSACKLYDYRGHRWLDFNGNPTTGFIFDKDLLPPDEGIAIAA